MVDYSNGSLMRLRRIAQSVGVIRPVVRLYRKIAGTPYEDSFQTESMAAIREGDIVWDVGANIGYYTRPFAEKAGTAGKVVAFEPSPATAVLLREAVRDLPTVVVQQVALSDASGKARFYTSADSVTDGLASNGKSDVNSVEVEVRRGDEYFSDYPPNVIKVDVEGFECEVIAGLGTALRDPRLRSVLVEIHFQELNKRGLTDAPRQIVKMLEQSGFSIRWTDPSHVVATRRA